MAEKTAQNHQTNEKNHKSGEKQPGTQPDGIQLNPALSMMQQLQKTCGNRAVQRLIQPGVRRQPPSAALHSVIQLLRSGTLGGVHYDENPRDTISIRMHYQVESFEAILTGVDRVVGLFGSSGRTYSDDQSFQTGLRDYLTSIDHPAARGGGPGMSRDRWLRFRIRLVRGEGRRIEGLEFLEPFESVRMGEPEIEVPEPESESAEEETTPAPAAGTPATEQPAPTAEEDWSARGIASRIAGGAEWLGNLASGRWVWDPVSSQMQEWEAELDRIGERGEGGTVGQVLLVPVSLLFVILGAITGLLDTLARLNPANLVLQGVATGIRATTGEYTADQFREDAAEVGWEAFDIITLGLRNAYHHMREGIREANVFRVTQAAGEIILAAIALIGIVRGVRGRMSSTRMGRAVEAEAARPAEPGPEFAERPTEPAPDLGERPTESGPELGERATEPGPEFGERPTEPGRGVGERPTEPGPEFGERPTEPGSEFGERSTEPGRGVGERPTEPGPEIGERSTEPGPEFGERATEPGEPAGRRTNGAAEEAGETPSAAGRLIGRTTNDPAVARAWRDAHLNEGPTPGFMNLAEYLEEWRSIGGRGPAPLAFEDVSTGRLLYNAREIGLPSAEQLRGGMQGSRRTILPPEPTPAERSGGRAAGAGEQAIETPPATGRLIGRTTNDPAVARAWRDAHLAEGGTPGFFNLAEYLEEWRSVGGQGPAPLAFEDLRTGRLLYNARELGLPSAEQLRGGMQSSRPGVRPAEPIDVNAPTGEQAAVRPAEPVDVNAPTGEQAAVRPAEPVDVNAPTGEQAAVRPAEPVDVNAPTGQQAAVRPVEPAETPGGRGTPAEQLRPAGGWQVMRDFGQVEAMEMFEAWRRGETPQGRQIRPHVAPREFVNEYRAGGGTAPEAPHAYLDNQNTIHLDVQHMGVNEAFWAEESRRMGQLSQQQPGGRARSPAAEPAAAPPAPQIAQVFNADNIAAARRVLAVIEERNLPRFPLNEAGMQHRCAGLGLSESTVAYLTEDGRLVYNREVLSTSTE